MSLVFGAIRKKPSRLSGFHVFCLLVVIVVEATVIYVYHLFNSSIILKVIIYSPTFPLSRQTLPKCRFN